MANEKDFDPEGLSDEEIAILEGEDGDEAEPVAVGDEDGAEIKAAEGDEPAPEGIDPDEGEEPASEPEKPVNKAAEAPPGYVPNAALREAREELKQMKEWQRTVINKLTEQRQQPKEEQEPELPDWDTDPIGRMREVERRLQEREAQEAQTIQQQRELQQQAQRTEQIFGILDNEFRQVEQTEPDVREAYQHVLGSFENEIQMLGYRGPQAQQVLSNVYRNFLEAGYRARAEGVPIQDFVRNLAKARGWVKRENPAQRPDAGEKVERLAKAVETNRTIGKGGKGSGEMSLEDLAAMDGAELEALAEKNPELFASFGA